MNTFLSGQTLVIGHRGSPQRAAENTFESFDQAEADGADGIELDVRLSADGEPVVLHDPDLSWRERKAAIGALTMPELSEIVVERGSFSGRIPTLRDVFLRYGGSLAYLVELKTGPSPRPGLLEFRVVALLTQLHLLERAIVLSFSAEALRRVRDVQPAIQTCLVFDGTAYRHEGALWPDLPAGCRAIAPQHPLATDRLLAAAQEAGLGVHVWTVNEPSFAKTLAERGAASVVTDVPHEVSPAVREVTGRSSAMSLMRSA